MRFPTRLTGAGLLGAFAMLASCGFESADEEPRVEMNMCSADTECDANAVCQEGRCVAESADNPLTVLLEISPLSMPDGSEPLPFIQGGFRVEGPAMRHLELPLPVEVRGAILSEGAPVAAHINFTPTARIPSVPPKVIAASVGAEPESPDAGGFHVQLLSGAEYRMSVYPRAGELPPIVRTVTATAGADYDIDYDEIELEERVFVFDDTYEERPLRVRAVDRRTGETLSSVAPLRDGEVRLLFPAGSETPYRLVISAEQEYMLEAATDGSEMREAEMPSCDVDTPTFPVFSIDDEVFAAQQLGQETDDERELLRLPAVPNRIRFRGSIELCDDPGVSEGNVPSLPVTLRSSAISFGEIDSPFAASYSATTDAHFDSESGQFRFCVDLLPGEYEVVVSPPESARCSVFAERRLIRAPDGVAATGSLLKLPSAVQLTGELRTSNLTPLRAVTVAAIALGRSDVIVHDQPDPSLTQFNRSRETTSDDDGAFALLLDPGSYDIVVRPPEGSGFPWQVQHDVTFNRGPFDTVFDMRAPVSVEGSLAYEGTTDPTVQASLEGAAVRAFVVIDDPFDTDRGIAVGRATADAAGEFTLLLPPMLRSGL